jgi:abortive infection bacteriophage resistance protein
MPCSKLPTSVLEQIDILKSRGLVCQNDEDLHHFLSYINYYRLGYYLYSFRVNHKQSENFKENTNFTLIENIYDFDQELRISLFKALNTIEISLRKQLASFLCLELKTPFPKVLVAEHDKNGNKKNYDGIEKSYNKFVLHKGKTNHPVIKLCKKCQSKAGCNDKTKVPPLWATVEVFDFGDILSIFKAISNTNVKIKIINALLPSAKSKPAYTYLLHH